MIKTCCVSTRTLEEGSCRPLYYRSLQYCRQRCSKYIPPYHRVVHRSKNSSTFYYVIYMSLKNDIIKKQKYHNTPFFISLLPNKCFSLFNVVNIGPQLQLHFFFARFLPQCNFNVRVRCQSDKVRSTLPIRIDFLILFY